MFTGSDLPGLGKFFAFAAIVCGVVGYAVLRFIEWIWSHLSIGWL